MSTPDVNNKRLFTRCWFVRKNNDNAPRFSADVRIGRRPLLLILLLLFLFCCVLFRSRNQLQQGGGYEGNPGVKHRLGIHIRPGSRRRPVNVNASSLNGDWMEMELMRMREANGIRVWGNNQHNQSVYACWWQKDSGFFVGRFLQPRRKEKTRVQGGEYWSILIFSRFLESAEPQHKKI